LIERVVSLAKNQRYRLKRVAAGAVWGEPLMNRDYFRNTQRIADAFPGASVCMTTNGSLLTTENIDRIMDSHQIMQVAVSVDAGTKETYEKIRKGGKWEVLIENLSQLIERRRRGDRRPLVSTNFVVMRRNFREIPTYVKQMASLGVDVIGAVNVHNLYSSDINETVCDFPCESSDVKGEREEVLREASSIELPPGISLRLPSFRPCRAKGECSFEGASTTVIGIEGGVYPCCVIQSLNYEGRPDAKPMGNVFDEKLDSIWNSRAYQSFRQTMLKGEVPHRICVECPFFYGM
jgi:radical SAM protein with 4Fe4S-binding SPASM domain